MPVIANDLSVQRAANEEAKVRKAEEQKKAKAARKKDQAAIAKVRNDYAAEKGIDPKDVKMIICKRGRNSKLPVRKRTSFWDT